MTGTETQVREPALSPIVWILLGLPLLAGLFVRLAFPDAFAYTIWSDRDLLRAFNLWQDFQVAGAEINGAYYGRVPGGFYYYILGFFDALSHTPFHIYILQSVFIGLGFFAVYTAGLHVTGRAGALIAAGAYALSPGVLDVAGQIWNPALSLPMSATAVFLFTLLLKGRPWILPLLIGLLVATIQVHMSNLALLIGMIAVLVVVPTGLKLRHWSAAVLVGVSLYLPYIVVEAQNDFVNTRLILSGFGGPIYSAPNPGLVFRAVLTVVGGGAFEASSGYDKIFDGAGIVLLLGIGTRFLLAIQRCGIGFSPLTWRRNLGRAAPSERILVGLGLVLLICFAALSISRNGVYIRYVLFTIPLLALLTGAALSEAMAFFRRIPYAAYVVSILFAAVFCSHAYNASRLASKETVNAVESAEIALSALENHTGLGRSSFRDALLFLNRTGKADGWRQMGYLLETGPTQGAEHPSDDRCFVLVATPDPTEARAALSAADGLTFPAAEHLFDRDGYSAFSYRLAAGNCYTNFANPYHRSDAERFAHEACLRAPADGIVFSGPAPQPGHRRLVARHTFSPTRLCLGVDVFRQDRTLYTELFSSDLRGYTGYTISGYKLTKAQLILTPEGDGETTALTLNAQPLGGLNNVVTTPWKAAFDAPGTGRYSGQLHIELVANDNSDTRVTFSTSLPSGYVVP